MSDDKKPFTVNDRRLFTPEGEARGDAPEESPPSAETERNVSPPLVGDEEEDAGPPGELDFIGLLVSLGAQAGALLGGGPGEPGGESHVDLPAARSIIGLLETLEKKTEGRRTPEEDQVMA